MHHAHPLNAFHQVSIHVPPKFEVPPSFILPPHPYWLILHLLNYMYIQELI